VVEWLCIVVPEQDLSDLISYPNEHLVATPMFRGIDRADYKLIQAG
jgi:hypothetical protein